MTGRVGTGASPELVVAANTVFLGNGQVTGPGYVAISADRIVAVGAGDGRDLIGTGTDYRHYGDALICPAFHDNHTFITGTLTDGLGVDMSNDATAADALTHLAYEHDAATAGGVMVGHGWAGAAAAPSAVESARLERLSGTTPTVLFGTDTATAWMNVAARTRYGVQAGFPDNESKAQFFRDIAQDAGIVERAYRRAAGELASRGVVSVKDIGFDDYLGILPVLERLHRSEDFDLRVHFSFQPVDAAVDIDAIVALQARYRDPQLRFYGIKLMTDGFIPEGTADVLGRERPPVDYATIAATALALDRAGVPVGLNADGDAAVRECLDIFQRCLAENGSAARLRFLSDASLAHPADVRRMGELGVTLEIYPQFLLLFETMEGSFMDKVLGAQRTAAFNDYRGMVDAGAYVTAGTDLPLFWPSIPDAVYAASHRRFADLQPAGGWHHDRGMTPLEVLDSWTSNGARACGLEGWTGNLDLGLRADITVLSRDVLTAPVEEVRDTEVLLTLAGGRIVHEVIGASNTIRVRSETPPISVASI